MSFSGIDLTSDLTPFPIASFAFSSGPEAHLRGLGGAAHQKVFRGMISSPMLANHNTTHQKYSTTHNNKHENKTTQLKNKKYETTNLKTNTLTNKQLNTSTLKHSPKGAL